MTLNQLFWKLTKEKFTLHAVNFGGAVKISTMFYQYQPIYQPILHINLLTLMLMLHIRESNYLVLTNALSTPFLMSHITFDGIRR